MTQSDWFRRTTWTATDAADFDARLKRSRNRWNQAQYLFIQAQSLVETGQASLLEHAIALCDRGIRDFTEPGMLAGTHLVKANALTDLGRYEAAIDEYRAAVAAQRAYPGMRHPTHLYFGELAVALQRTDLYGEIDQLLDRFGDGDSLFPAMAFRHFYLRAMIAEARGRRDSARQFARSALSETAKTQTEFRYHRRLGLFKGTAPEVLDELHRLAAA